MSVQLSSVTAVLCLIMSACSKARVAPSPTFTAVTTDRSSYVLSPGPPPGVDISVVLRNPARDSVYLAYCGREIEVDAEREGQGGWTPLYRHLCPAILVPPVAVPPGGTYTFTVTLRAPPHAAAESLVGTVRLDVHAFSIANAAAHSIYSALIADSLRMTAPFRITR